MEAKCAFLLALIACLEIVCVEGRPFWPKNKELISTIEANSKRELGEKGSQPTPPNPIASPMAPDHDSISGTHAAYKDDFRPTTPGNSPGVGHKFTNTREQPAKPRNLVTSGRPTAPGHSPAEARILVTVGRPTAPGHSPGVGHVLQVQNAKPSP